MFRRKFRRKRSVWALVFIVVTVVIAQAALPCSAKIIDGAKTAVSDAGDKLSEAVSDAGDKVSEAVSDVESKAEEIVTDAESKLDDASDGKVEDTDGIIGNETTAPEAQGMSKAGQAALIVLAVAAVVAVIIIITVASRKKDR